MGSSTEGKKTGLDEVAVAGAILQTTAWKVPAAQQQNGHIPSKYTCEGEEISPPLAWEGDRPKTKPMEKAIAKGAVGQMGVPKLLW